MSIVKPYTFVAGNKARANEVNEDFDVLYQQVNANITNIANVEGEIQTLSSTKANITGSSQYTFAVKNPESSSDAVNLQTFFKQIANSIDYIGGLTISKDSGSPNDTILVNPGAAYDSTKTVVLALDVLTSKQNTTQSPNSTYYVYIVSTNQDGTNPSIVIDSSSVQPGDTPPARYRKIGRYTTDSNGYINIIYDSSKSNSVSIVKTYLNGFSGYIILDNGFKIQWGQFTNNNRTDGKGPWQYFPNAYTSTPVVLATVCTDSGYITEDWRICDIKTAKFRGQSSENVVMNWISIGV